MSERVKRNARKPVKYDFSDQSDDDDFVPSAPRTKSEKSKTSTKEKPAVKRAKTDIPAMTPKVSLQRMKVEDRVFERELELALELSKKADDSEFRVSPDELSTVSVQETVVIDVDSDSPSVDTEILMNEPGLNKADEEGVLKLPEGDESFTNVPKVSSKSLSEKPEEGAGDDLVTKRKSNGLTNKKSNVNDVDGVMTERTSRDLKETMKNSDAVDEEDVVEMSERKPSVSKRNNMKEKAKSNDDDENSISLSKKRSKRLKVDSDEENTGDGIMPTNTSGVLAKESETIEEKSKAVDNKKTSKKSAVKSDSEFEDSDEISDCEDDSDFDDDVKGKNKRKNSKKVDRNGVKETKLKKTDSGKVTAKPKTDVKEKKPAMETKRSGNSTVKSTSKSTTATSSSSVTSPPSISSPLAATLMNRTPLLTSRVGIRVGLSRSARVKPLHPSLHEKF